MGFGSNKGFTPGEEGLEVKDVDGAPDVTGVKVIRVSNGTLTDDGNGQVTIDTSGGGGGDVSGPGASTDRAIARWDGVNGDTLLDSVVTIADNGEVVIAPTAGAFDALHIDKDDASILFGDAGHIKIKHGANHTSSAGLTLSRINTGAGSSMTVAIQTSENTITAGEDLGSLIFITDQTGGQHKAENLPAAGLTAIAENTFSANLNATSLAFKTATNAAATEKMRLTHSGSLGIGTSTPGSPLHVVGNTTSQGHTLPQADNIYDLGSPAKRWANVYTGDLHLANDRGNWTVIEESDFLSLRNNKTGKRFKIMMEEITEDDE
jgi:hypothetical protein